MEKGEQDASLVINNDDDLVAGLAFAWILDSWIHPSSGWLVCHWAS